MNWSASLAIEEWDGVSVDAASRRVTGLNLGATGLDGQIPADLGQLDALEELYLNANRLDGTIPSTLGSLTNLRVLSLSQNRLSGEIPSALGDLTSLQSLYLDGNRLTGEIPAALGGLANLRHIRLSGNPLTGCVPRGLLGALVEDQPLELPPCEPPATPGSLTVVIALAGPRAPVRINTPITLTAAFSQPVSDFTADDIRVAFGAAANFAGAGASYTFDVSPSAAGPVTVDIPAGSATDAGGSGNAAAGQLQLGIPYDDNNDAGISKAEAIAAITDYFALRISKAQAIGMINLYFASPAVVPIGADAGPNAEALESDTVTLDGRGSTGPAGSISSYRWEQVINGSGLVSLSGGDTAVAAFTLPELSGDESFLFRLTVAYNTGEASQDEVVITGRPIPGVVVGEVSGNTASFGSTAEFSVRLRSRTWSQVVIPVSSSDPSEGVAVQSQVVFTPENWDISQRIAVSGRNPAVREGRQDYEIILGRSRSSDALYNGLDAIRVRMRGIALEIGPPEVLDPLIANIPAVIRPSITYTGSSLLSFSLAESPPGMSIDFSLGTISWTPQESDEGRSFDVTVRANDGALFAEISFQVGVVAPEAIATEAQGNVLTVRDPDTTLNGMSVTAMARDTGGPVTLPTVEKVPPESVPERSSSVTPMSDVFLVKSSYENPVELRWPVGGLPDGASVNDVDFYGYTEVLGSEGEGNIWAPLGLEVSLEGTGESPVFVVRLGGLEGMGFFGHQSTRPAIPFETTPSGNELMVADAGFGLAEPSIGDIRCMARDIGTTDGIAVLDYDHFTCTYMGDPNRGDPEAEVKIIVENFGKGCRWMGKMGPAPDSGRGEEEAAPAVICKPGSGASLTETGVECEVAGTTPPPTVPCADVNDLVAWLVAAQEELEGVGLGI